MAERGVRGRSLVWGALALAAGLYAGAVVAVVPAEAPVTGVVTAAQDPVSCSSSVALGNGGFELPAIPANDLAFLHQNQVPGWYTTATDRQIELWRNYQNVPAGSGAQFAELNANQVSTLYQDVPTTPGQTLRWELKHRGRLGVDTMAVHIAVPGVPLSAATRQGGNLSDGRTAWGTHSGVYTVPLGQTTTRFAFQSVSASGGNTSVGNFLDGISFGTGPCLLTTETVATQRGGALTQVGDVLTYTVTTRNDGGNPARATVVTDELPAGVAFVPGSIRVTTGATTAARTDAAGDDVAEYDAATRTVRARIGEGATASAGGSVAPGEAHSVSWQVRVQPAASATTVSDDATVGFTDPLTGTARTSRSTTVSTPVGAAADLAVSLAQSPAALVAGSSTTWTATVRGNGPSTEPAPVVSVSLPAQLSGVTASSTDGPCTIAGGTVTCRLSALASGAGRTVTVSGTVPPGSVPGTQHTVSAAATGDTHDHAAGNNTASATSSVTASADVSVTLAADRPQGVAGGTVVYTATVRGDGPSTARGVVLLDALPDGSTLLGASVPGGSCSMASGSRSLRCTVPDLAPGESAAVRIELQLSASGAGEVDNAVSVSATTPDPDVADLTAEVSGGGTRLADIGVDLQVDPQYSTVRPGDRFPFTLVVSNDGPSDATNVVVRATLAPGVVTAAISYPGCTPGAGCSIPVLTAGERLVITGQAVVGPAAEEGTGGASVTAVSAVPDGNPGNDTDAVTAEVVLEADLALSQTVENAADPSSPVVPGTDVRTLVTVVNAGPTRAESLLVSQAVGAGQVLPANTSSAGGTCTFSGRVEDGVAVDGGVLLCTLGELAAGQTWQLTHVGLLRSSWTDATLTRTRTVTAASADPVSGNDTSSVTVPVERRADVAVAKTADTPGVVQSDPVRFTVTATNLGPSDARDVLVREEPRPGVVVSGATPSAGTYSDSDGTWRIPTLAAGQTVTLVVDGTAQAATDVVNGAVLLASDALDPDPDNDGATATVAVTPADRELRVQTRAAVPAGADPAALRAGDTVDLTYEVANDGNVVVSGIRLQESLTGGGVTCPRGQLAPGETMTCRANSTHRVTQGEFDLGAPVTSVVTASGRTPDRTADLDFDPVRTELPLAAGAPAVGVTLVPDWDDADGDGALDAGETVVWTAVVVNRGDVTLTDPVVDAPGAPALACDAAVLAPGRGTTCVASPYTVTADDVLAGQRTVTAGVTATARRTGSPVQAAPSSVALPDDPRAALGLTLTGEVAPPGRPDAADLGDVVTWRYVVTNLGTVAVRDVAVDDAGAGAVTCDATVLAPGATTGCAAVRGHVVDEDDLLAGRLTGRATAAGVPAALGGTVRSAPAEDVVGLAGLVRSLEVTVRASAGDPSLVRTGTELRWAHGVANTGNVTMRLVTVSDDLLGPIGCVQDVLAPGEATTCTAGAGHRVTQAEFDAGRPVGGTAWVSGVPAGSDAALPFGPASDPVALAAAAPALTLVSVPDWDDRGAAGVLEAGETVQWSLLVTNTGDVTLPDVSASGSLAGPATCTPAALAPGATARCGTGAHTVTAAEESAGTLHDDAVAWAADPRGGPGTSAHATSSVPASPRPEVVTVAAAEVVGGTAPADLGDRVRWHYTVTNVGTVPLDAVAVQDARGGTVTCDTASLRPGGAALCTGDALRTVSEADLRAGEVGTDATATATWTAGAVTVTSPPAAVVMATAAPVGRLQLAGTATGTASAVGDRITYRWVVSNAGTATMTGVEVADSAGGTATCAATVLAPSESTDCTGGEPYTLGQGDMDAGRPVGLTATALGTPGSGSVVRSGPASAPVAVAAARPALTAVTTADWADDGDRALEAGETVTWTVAVTNTGDVTLEDLRVSDPQAYVGCPVSRLPVGRTERCVSDPAVLTEGDAAAGERTTTAEASAASVRDGAVVRSGPAGARVSTAPAPSLALTSVALVGPPARQAAADLGDTVTWHLVVTNTGNVPVTGITVTGAAGALAGCATAVLAPGGSAECATDGHVVTETDLLAGQVGTDAVAVGTAALTGAEVRSPSATGAVPTTAPRAAVDLALEHQRVSGDGTATLRPGVLVRTRYQVTNTGTLTLTGVAVTDAVAGPVTCRQTVLAPARSTTCAADRPREVTAEDVAAGHLTSWATVAAVSGLGTVADDAMTTEAVPPEPQTPGPQTPGPGPGPGTAGGPADVPATTAPAGHTAAPDAAAPSTAAPDTAALARTGVEVAAHVGTAGALLLAGAALLLATRRRRGDA
ncbi:DUF7507 domain-containing protein [Geodermatophilus normandii]|uniref:DUF11 domain-containing protein n=1 Tax=Geodermatophilus normandii TaxID=1137989 RepID=A0A6P0GJP0_9ACTN|nr:DUF11 domain-containing protein [Geodermatophilus normandii]